MKQIFGAVFAAVLTLTSAPAALGHVGITPHAVATHTRAEFRLHLREEVEGAHTTRVEMTIPDGFSVDAVADDDEGWTGDIAGRVVTWTGRGELDLHFTGTSGDAADYAFKVRQEYSNEAVMNWTGPHASEMPAAVVFVSDGGGLPTLVKVLIAFLGAGLLVGVAGALLARNRPLA